MEFLAFLYTVLLVAICLMMALLLFRSGRPAGGLDEADCEELKDWLEERLAAQAREFNARQDAIAQQNYAAIRSVSETLQTAVQSMSTTLGQGQDSQQRILERRLQSLEQANNQQMEQLRRAMVESMTALQAENTRKLDEIRHTVDEQLQDALQKRVTESFKAVNQQLEQVYKGLGEMDPDQLWETTMEPETRTLLQVNIDDAAEAERVVSELMGDQVEPRKEFIQKHARDVRFLDI